MPTKFPPSKRTWWIAGLAVAVAACLLVCGLGAFWLQRAFVGESPGQGERARLGY